MNLIDVNTMFPTDDKCRELLARCAGPKASRCLRCKREVVELETEKQLFYCKECDYQFSVTAGTVFNDSHLPLENGSSLRSCSVKRRRGCRLARFSARSESAATRQHGISATESAPRWRETISRCSMARSRWTKPMSAARPRQGLDRAGQERDRHWHSPAQRRTALLPCQRCESRNARAVHPRERQRRRGRDYDR